MQIENNYLASVKKEFQAYKRLGERSISQLKPEQLFIVQNENSNSIALIVKHLHGNMLSRWTDFLTTDGEKSWRKRDEEFEEMNNDREMVIKIWEEGWGCFFSAIDSIKPEQLSATIFIRGEAHTILEAINRQLAHYAYHIGQIVFAAKELKEGEWVSLSIPKRKK